MKKQPTPTEKYKYYNIMTMEGDGSNEATILLYGYIGEEWSFDSEDGWKMTGVTDVEFVKELDELASKYAVIHIRINSIGGEVFHGSAIVSAIRRCKAEVHTWIDGVAASMAGGIWFAGHKRHMAKNAMLMLHSPINICWGNAKDMRDCALVLDQFAASLVNGIAEATGKDAAAIAATYFNDYQDHWLTYDDCDREGFVTDKEEAYTAASPMPSNVASMNYHDIVKQFKAQQQGQSNSAKDEPKTPSIFDDFKAAVADLKNIISPKKDEPVMNLQEFKTSLQDGSLNLDEVKAYLATLNAPATDNADLDALKAELTALKTELGTFKAKADEVDALKSELETLKNEPGAARSTPGAQATEPGGQPSRYAQLQNMFREAAESGEPVRFVAG